MSDRSDPIDFASVLRTVLPYLKDSGVADGASVAAGSAATVPAEAGIAAAHPLIAAGLAGLAIGGGVYGAKKASKRARKAKKAVRAEIESMDVRARIAAEDAGGAVGAGRLQAVAGNAVRRGVGGAGGQATGAAGIAQAVAAQVASMVIGQRQESAALLQARLSEIDGRRDASVSDATALVGTGIDTALLAVQHMRPSDVPDETPGAALLQQRLVDRENAPRRLPSIGPAMVYGSLDWKRRYSSAMYR